MSNCDIKEIIDFISDGNVSDFSFLSVEEIENKLETNSCHKLTTDETESSEDEVANMPLTRSTVQIK